MTQGWRRVIRFALDHSLLLVIGAVAAVLWANLSLESYERVTHHLHFVANDIGMAFFFALAAKEVYEATLPGGALASLRHAAPPLAAAVGGMLLPAAIYAGSVSMWGPADLARGWAIPCATDIAFSAMVARLVFPAGHAAIPFLLLLAIADDALGLLILAVFYPSGSLSPVALVTLMAAAIVTAIGLRQSGVRSFWPYVLGPGVLSWSALYIGGLHPALALVPIVPLMPHARQDAGLFELHDRSGDDTLNRFEHWWATPVQVILFVFGLANAGVSLAALGPGTYYVLAGLFFGKPLGIMLFAGAAQLAGARLPADVSWRALSVIGVTASIGFTVSLFFATAAFPSGDALAQVKMGALLSFLAAPVAYISAVLMQLRSPTLQRK